MCLYPVRMKSNNGKIVERRCGHCIQCLKQYQDEWTARLSEEVRSWSNPSGPLPVVFFTLDYNNDCIPCSYLCCTSEGVYISDLKPDCEILPFWTQIKEPRKKWLSRRRSILTRYWQYNIFHHFRRSQFSDVPLSGYIPLPEGDDVFSMNFARSLYVRDYMPSCPEEIDVPFVCSSVLEHPDISCPIRFLESSGDFVDTDSGEIFVDPSLPSPDFALEFHSFDKKQVQDVLKNFRRQLEYHIPDVFGRGKNPRCVSVWNDHGVERPLPSAAVPSSFKYFITSEYGPETQRPHFHGLIFGVTRSEFEKYFVPLWKYGTVKFDTLDPSLGAGCYVSKYCSKGDYENDYCRKYFAYEDKDYLSKDYDFCISDFGINAPLCHPTFHLISHGIGACYVYNSERLDYFGVKLSPYFTPSCPTLS